jgi:hypothetical protein
MQWGLRIYPQYRTAPYRFPLEYLSRSRREA